MEELIKELDRKVGALRTTNLICPDMENLEWFEEVKEYVEDKDLHSLKDISSDILYNNRSVERHDGEYYVDDEEVNNIRLLLNQIIEEIKK